MMQENQQYANDALKELNDYRFNRDLQRYRDVSKKLIYETKQVDKFGKIALAAGASFPFVVKFIKLFSALSISYSSSINELAILVGLPLITGPVLFNIKNAFDSEDNRSSLKLELSELEERLHNYQK